MTFEELKLKLNSRLKAVAHKLNGRAAFLNEEDLYQEGLMHLWQCFEKGLLSDKTESYIVQGYYFHLRNYLRTELDKVSLVSFESFRNEEGREFEENIPSLQCEPLTGTLDSKLAADTLMNNGLTKREKEVCALFLEGLTVREIGSRLGISHVRVVKIKDNIRRKYSYLLE